MERCPAPFDSLATHLQPCTAKNDQHQAMLHLKHFPQSNSEENDGHLGLTMLLKSCPEPTTWQQVECILSSDR